MEYMECEDDRYKSVKELIAHKRYIIASNLYAHKTRLRISRKLFNLVTSNSLPLGEYEELEKLIYNCIDKINNNNLLPHNPRMYIIIKYNKLNLFKKKSRFIVKHVEENNFYLF